MPQDWGTPKNLVPDIANRSNGPTIVATFTGIYTRGGKLDLASMSRNTSRLGTASFSTDFERIHESLERSTMLDWLRNEPIATPNPSRNHETSKRSSTDCLRNEAMATLRPWRKIQSASDLDGLTRIEQDTIPLPTRVLAFLWRRPAKSQVAQETQLEMAGSCESVEDIKERWRRRQIAMQQRNAAPGKASIWSALNRKRRSLS